MRRLVSFTIGEAFEQAIVLSNTHCRYVQGASANIMFQGFTDLHERATVMSIDGIGVYYSISRRTMLEGFRSVSDGVTVFFV